MQIKVKNLSHIFTPKTPWEFQALDNLNLEINQGEYIGIIGATGSGKTTLIEHLNALLKPTMGEIEWVYKDQELAKNKKYSKYVLQDDLIQFIYPDPKRKHSFKGAKKIRQKIGVVFQFAEYQLFKGTILEDITFGPIAYGQSKEVAYEKAKDYLAMVGLSEEYLSRSPFELSGGQKRRVAIAGILAMEPDVLIVDEPTAGLDPVGIKEILDILSDLNKKGKTIINVTHDLDNVLERASRVVLLKKGKIAKDGDVYEILNDVEFLKQNNLQPPKLLEFVNKLRVKGIDVPKVTSIDELAEFLNNYLTNKGRG
ncbi:energy-coupling factor transporter ATPase [Mycoplasma sp. NEAQ87857]|uniref:energy-coupling factor transporter ATPase n=1 Tax=Mycoplasma sp. NEAQ87857 TaxID=2683967 RepID=UPI001316610D|nr:energy-coupling factor transporter ATPase [Mycoplasma sp. NEAQ87857]QGZ97407.1 energy-coupling factor transporter ATPase [Mycoplasma sp. NEAQ87857]